MFRVAPFYLDCDVSLSMEGDPIAALNQALMEIYDHAVLDPALSEVVRLGIIDFSGDAEVRLAPAQLSESLTMPTLTCRTTGTAYSAGFDLLRGCLPTDVLAAKQEAAAESDGGVAKILRPIVFFLSDGKPTESDDVWMSALDRLKDPAFIERPNIFAFGIGDADVAVIKRVASHPEWAWIQATDGSMTEAIAGFASQMLQTMTRTASGTAAAAYVPQTPAGMVPAIDLDESV